MGMKARKKLQVQCTVIRQELEIFVSKWCQQRSISRNGGWNSVNGNYKNGEFSKALLVELWCCDKEALLV